MTRRWTNNNDADGGRFPSAAPAMLMVRIASIALIALVAPVGLDRASAQGAQEAEDLGEALREAARAGDLARVTELLDAGVDPNGGNRYGSTALFFAADRGHADIVRLLLERGADVNRQDTFYNASPLTWTLMNDHARLTQLLIEAGATGVDEALAYAVRQGNLQLARAALDSRLVSAESAAGALQAARTAGHGELTDALTTAIEAGDVVAAAPDTTDATEDEADASALLGYVGSYRNEEAEVSIAVAVAENEPALTVAFVEQAPLRLEAAGENRFRSESEDLTLEFGGRGGLVERVEVSGPQGTLVMVPFDAAAAAKADDGADDAPDPSLMRAAPRTEATNWPGFRGNGSTGVGDGQGAPTQWDVATGQNVLWKMPLPGLANSSPIVWGDRVFLTTAISSAGDDTVRIGLYGDVAPVDDVSEHSWKVYALDKRSGEILWEKEAFRGEPQVKRHPKSSQANSTPVTDGEHVVAVFGSIGKLLCYDFDGELLWERDTGVLDAGWFYDPGYQWGHASSPVIYDGTVIVQADVQGDGTAFLAAYDLETGTEVWRTARDEIPTWSTPVVYRGRSRDELITNSTTIRSYNPATGEELWSLGPSSELVVASPIIADGLVYVTAGYPPVRPIYVIRPGGVGDISLPKGVESNEHVVWSKGRGGIYIPSPLVYRGIYYAANNDGRLTAYDAPTGEIIYRQRIGGTGGSYVASPVAADGKLYFASEDGTVHVATAGSTYQPLSSNEVGEVIWATPAISDGVLILRTINHVYGIAETSGR